MIKSLFKGYGFPNFNPSLTNVLEVCNSALLVTLQIRRIHHLKQMLLMLVCLCSWLSVDIRVRKCMCYLL